MEFGFTKEDLSFRAQVIQFMEKEVTPEAVADVESGLGLQPAIKAFNKKLGAKGWLTVTWPREYGGIGGTHVQKLIVDEARAYYRVYDVVEPLVGAGMAGPIILMFGSEEQKREYLPPIAAGEIEFALGYTEPQAGSDLAALDIRAVLKGDEYVLNGQKLFNTGVHFSDFHWLGVRTDPDAPKHKGVSLLIVDLKSPGISISPLWAMNGMRTNVVYYDNVRVPKRNLVGEPGKGFYYIAKALDFERIFPVTDLVRSLEELVEYLKQTRANGSQLANDALVRQRVAEMAVELEAARLLTYQIAWKIDQGSIPNYESSMLKLYASEMAQRMAILAAQILGPLGQLREGGHRTPLHGHWSRNYLRGIIRPIVGGTSEIQRNIIATRGLGLPRG